MAVEEQNTKLTDDKTNYFKPDLTAISLTHVKYIKGDFIGYILAWCSLVPFCILGEFVTLIIFRRDLHTYKVGDYVQISHLTTKFTRAYDETYTGDLFKISKRYFRATLPVYRLKDLMNEETKGTLYESKLQKVDMEPNKMWKVEKVLKSRGRGQNKQYFVKWKYYPKKFNSWISASDTE